MIKNLLYNVIINKVTDYCYMNCLDYFPKDSVILDVGIGNGKMLKSYHSLIKSKNLKIIGIDINESYLNHSARLIKNLQVEDHVELYRAPIETYERPDGRNFDYIIFSMSFMLFDNQHFVLDKVADWLNPGGEIIFFQTMFKKKSRLIEFIKPKLKYITTIDFGRVTYDKDFYDILNEKNLSVSQDRMIKKEWFKGEYRMIAASPEIKRAASDPSYSEVSGLKYAVHQRN